MLLSQLLLACHSISLPLGTWRIEGENEIGGIRHVRAGWNHNQVEVALFTEHASTDGYVVASVTSENETHWLRFHSNWIWRSAGQHQSARQRGLSSTWRTVQ